MIARAASFDAEEAAAAVGGRLVPGRRERRPFEGVATDTRDALEEKLFVALVGARFDAHDFLAEAVRGGAAGLVVEETGFERVGGRGLVGAELDVIVVQDTLQALGALARHHRRRLGTPVLALTGSNGKTSTKEMLASILAVERTVLATEGNLNNLIGLPLTLLGLEPSHAVCVAEMGMNALTEIARMVAIAEPRVGLVTNIGPAHIGELGSIENIAKAKGEMYEGLHPSSGVAVVNLDDPRVVAAADAAGVSRRRTFGVSPGADVQLLGARATSRAQRIRLAVDGIEVEADLPLFGHHQALNAAAAVAASTALGDLEVSIDAMVEGLEATPTMTGRGQVRSVGAFTVIDDSYNANAASMLASISTAAELAKGRRLVAAVGEMKELGRFSAAAHREVGEALAGAGAAVVGAFGPEALPVVTACTGEARHEPEDFDDLAKWLLARLRPGDVVLVKGSRAARMERLIRCIEGVA